MGTDRGDWGNIYIEGILEPATSREALGLERSVVTVNYGDNNFFQETIPANTFKSGKWCSSAGMEIKDPGKEKSGIIERMEICDDGYFYFYIENIEPPASPAHGTLPLSISIGDKTFTGRPTRQLRSDEQSDFPWAAESLWLLSILPGALFFILARRGKLRFWHLFPALAAHYVAFHYALKFLIWSNLSRPRMSLIHIRGDMGEFHATMLMFSAIVAIFGVNLVLWILFKVIQAKWNYGQNAKLIR